MSSKVFSHFAAASIGLAAILLTPNAQAQDEEPVDIEVGSTRIGGPGTAKQRRDDAAWDAAAEEEAQPMTEETLPPKGDKKRMPGLHKLARQYFGGKMWKDACDKYDQIVEEGGDEALDADPKLNPDAKKNAARSFYECAQIAFFGAEYDKVEKLLKKSEKYAPSDHRHAGLRHKINRENYRRSMANGDVAGAMTTFRQYQQEDKDEDERIWMGEELAKLAWAAYQSKDKIAMKDYIRYADEVAPMNTELRNLKKKIEGEEAVLSNILIWGGAAIAFVILATQLSKWRARAKVKAASGNAFDADGLDGEA